MKDRKRQKSSDSNSLIIQNNINDISKHNNGFLIKENNPSPKSYKNNDNACHSKFENPSIIKENYEKLNKKFSEDRERINQIYIKNHKLKNFLKEIKTENNFIQKENKNFLSNEKKFNFFKFCLEQNKIRENSPIYVNDNTKFSSFRNKINSLQDNIEKIEKKLSIKNNLK